MRGTLHSIDDGRLALRFERRFAHPPEKVWQALTTPAGLNAWFPVKVPAFSPAVGTTAGFDLTVSLDVLTEHLAGTASAGSVWDRAEALRPAYVGE